MNIRDKFLELTQYTEVFGEEHLLRKYLPSNLKKDSIGNYWLKIGDSNSMFTAHLDTATKVRKKINHVFDGDIVGSDKTTLLGADDRSGVVILLYMIEHNIPGLYYFFIGEEKGRIGSSGIIGKSPESFKEYNKCISFDKNGYNSVVTKQSDDVCCSDEFALELSKQLSLKTDSVYKPDNKGSLTDSIEFIDNIQECTNISVGYFNEHTVNETQNISFLEKVCESVISIDWDSLPIVREINTIDSPNPLPHNPHPSDLPYSDLCFVFDVVCEIMEDLEQKSCINSKKFKPDKIMLFGDTGTAIIHYNGMININGVIYNNIIELSKLLFDNYNWRSFYLEHYSECLCS